MKHDEFQEIVLQPRLKKTESVLSRKSKEYARSEDRFHNFKRAAAMLSSTPEQALMGMLSKHVVSIMDMVDDTAQDKNHELAQWDEKLGDAINYLILLEGLIVERHEASL